MRELGNPLVCIPPAFGYAGLNPYPALVQSHTVITVDLQGHGRTADIPERPLSIEQYAKDVVGLLKYLGISKADFFGESYGGNAAAMIAIRCPELVGRVVTYAAPFGPPLPQAEGLQAVADGFLGKWCECRTTEPAAPGRPFDRRSRLHPG